MRPEAYRRHAAECLQIAEAVTDPQNRILLIHMAQAWLLLAQQIEKNRASNTVYEPPSPPPRLPYPRRLPQLEASTGGPKLTLVIRAVRQNQRII